MEPPRAHPFNRKLVTVHDQPRIYIFSTSEQEDASVDKGSKPEKTGKEKEATAPFFGNLIENLMPADKVIKSDFVSIDQGLEDSLDTVRKKLVRRAGTKEIEGDKPSKKVVEHQRSIEERNAAQQAFCLASNHEQ